MTGQRPLPLDVWTVALHLTDTDYSPLGAGVVIDPRRILTSAHVVMSGGMPINPLWVTFPKLDGSWDRRKVKRVRVHPPIEVNDAAVLELYEDVPAKVTPAPLRCPQPADLTGGKWWASGFPNVDHLASDASGDIGGSAGFGQVQLFAQSRYGLQAGFSGAGLWSAQYDAVVGIVGGHNTAGDGRALTLFQIDKFLPRERLGRLARWTAPTAGEMALAAWGWSLRSDPESRRHWSPRGRGVSSGSEQGYRFRGRSAAITAIVDWLADPESAQSVLLVTGMPGVGKSAVLGRVVTTSDADIRQELPADDTAALAAPDSIACAAHAKGKTALDVACEIARAASAAIPLQVDDLAPALKVALQQRDSPPFNVVIDALDEATNWEQARSIVLDIILPVVHHCASLGAKIVVGTRPKDDGGDLLEVFAGHANIIDLDAPEFFDQDDLAEYALATLQLVGDERPNNPYADDAVAAPVARRIAERSDCNFLVAGLVARAHGSQDIRAVDPLSLDFTPTVDAALEELLLRLPKVGSVDATSVLTALAFAEAPGLTAGMWRVAVRALAGPVGEDDITQFARSSAANFLVESGSGDGSATYRLFHQALNDALLRDRKKRLSRLVDERALMSLFLAHGRSQGWAAAEPYLLRALPEHARRANLIDDLLLDDEYLMYADLRRLGTLADHATTVDGRARARMLHLTPQAIAATAADRAALFNVTRVLERLGPELTFGQPLAYRARWASVIPLAEWAILDSETRALWAVCSFTVAGRGMLASVGEGPDVRLWDVATAAPGPLLAGHVGKVRDLCPVDLDGRTLLASAGHDGTVRLWDPAAGTQVRVLGEHRLPVRAVCSFTWNGQVVVASAAADHLVRLWDVATGTLIKVMRGHAAALWDVCSYVDGANTMIAGAGADGVIPVWNVETGRQVHELTGHKKPVHGVCAFTLSSRPALASVGADGTIRTWDPRSGTLRQTKAGHEGRVWSVATLNATTGAMLVTASDDGTVRLWKAHSLKQQHLLQLPSGARDVCRVDVDNGGLLASAGADGTVRIWDLTAEPRRQPGDGHAGRVNDLCVTSIRDRPVLGSVGADATIRLWDLATGNQLRSLTGHVGGVRSVCTAALGGGRVLVSGGDDGTIRVWDQEAGDLLRTIDNDETGVMAVCACPAGALPVLASGGNDGRIRLWDAGTGKQLGEPFGHSKSIRALCSFDLDGRRVLASASHDKTARIWDLDTGLSLQTIGGALRAPRDICALTIAGRTRVLTVGEDKLIVWDPVDGAALKEIEVPSVGRVRPVVTDGRHLVATVGIDRRVRLWDPVAWACVLSVPVHHAVTACVQSGNTLAIGLTTGVVAIDFDVTHRVASGPSS